MPQRIVHLLEPVEIEEEQRARLRPAEMALERLFQQPVDLQPISQPGQGVVAGQLLKRVLRLAHVGQIGPAAAKSVEIAEIVQHRIARHGPPALLVRGHLDRQVAERCARRQVEAQRPLLALVMMLADLGDQIDERLADDVLDRNAAAQRDLRRDIAHDPLTVGFPEPSAPVLFEIIEKGRRAQCRVRPAITLQPPAFGAALHLHDQRDRQRNQHHFHGDGPVDPHGHERRHEHR